MEIGMRYRAAIFDMDGTILNTLEDLADSTNHILREYGMPARSLEEIRRFVGNGIRRLLEQAVAEGSTPETVNRVMESFVVYYREHCTVKTRPYEGIAETIRELRRLGVKTAVVSNKVDVAVQALIAQFFPGLFDAAAGEKAGIARKPAPDSVMAVLEELGIPREDAVYIGDSEVDYLTSRNAEMDAIMVDWGFRGEAFLRECGATNIVRRPEELVAYFT